MTNFPYGECGCSDGCACGKNPGPAAFIVLRNSNLIRCCTRCNLTSDSLVEVLIKKDLDSKTFFEVFFEYDPLSILVAPDGIDKEEDTNLLFEDVEDIAKMN